MNIDKAKRKKIIEAIATLRCAISDLQKALKEDEPRHLECAEVDVDHVSGTLGYFI